MMAERTGSRRSTRNHLQLNLDARDDDGEAAVEAEVVWETKKVSRGSEANGTDMTSPTTTIQAESANLKKYLMTGLQEAPGSASPQKRGKGLPLLRLSSFCKRRTSDATSAGGKRPSKRSKADSTPRTRSRRARRSNDMAKLKEIIATMPHAGQPTTILPEPHSGTSSGSSGQAAALDIRLVVDTHLAGGAGGVREMIEGEDAVAAASGSACTASSSASASAGGGAQYRAAIALLEQVPAGGKDPVAEAIPFPAQQVAEASEVTVVRSDADGDGDGDGGCDLDDDDTFGVDSAILDRMMAQYDSGKRHAAKPSATRRASSGAGKPQVPGVRPAVVTATTMLNAGKAHGRTLSTRSVASAAGTAGPAVSAQPPQLVHRKSSSSSTATPTASIPAKASAPSGIMVQANRPNALLPIDSNAAAPPSEPSSSAQSSGSKKKCTKQQIEQKKREAMNRKRLQNGKQLRQPADADAAAAAAAATAAADAIARARKQRQAETARAEQAQAQMLARTERARKNKERAMAIRQAKMAKMAKT